MRKTVTVVIEAPGRDQGKSFVLTEMAASKAEWWATRTFMAMAKSNVEIPDGIENAGIAGIATLSLKALAGMNPVDAEPLLAEMWTCVRIMPDPARPMVIRNLVDDDTEEVMTRLFLRRQVLDLHVNFSEAAARLNLAKAAAA